MKTTHYFRLLASSAIAFVLMAGLALSAGAQTVLVDFGSDTSYRGLSVDNPDDNGNYWNSLQPGLLVQDLVDIDNSVTTIDIGWNTDIGTDSYNGPAGATDETTLETDVEFVDVNAAALGNLGGAKEAVFDYVTGPSFADNRVRFQIQGLNPAKTYTLTFFGSHSFSDDAETRYSIYSDNTFTTLVASTTLQARDPVSFWLHNRDKVATISGLAPQTDNILYVQFVGATSNARLGYLNDMQIEASAAAAIFDGDYNDDGVVDAADYVLWRHNDPTNAPLQNDPSPGSVDVDDYNTWLAKFGNIEGGGSGSRAVPEPATLVQMLLFAIGLLSASRRR